VRYVTWAGVACSCLPTCLLACLPTCLPLWCPPFCRSDFFRLPHPCPCLYLQVGPVLASGAHHAAPARAGGGEAGAHPGHCRPRQHPKGSPTQPPHHTNSSSQPLCYGVPLCSRVHLCVHFVGCSGYYLTSRHPTTPHPTTPTPYYPSLQLVEFGCDTFDSCYPTRVGRHGTMLTNKGPLRVVSGLAAGSSCGAQAHRLMGLVGLIGLIRLAG